MVYGKNKRDPIADSTVLEDGYPMMSCLVHRVPKPGYYVCRHVANGADIAMHLPATSAELGHIVCEQCYGDEASEDSLRLARVAEALELHCADCVAYHLGERLPRIGSLGVVVH